MAPLSIIVPDMIPGRKIARQHPPLTAGSGAIEDRVQHFADVDRSLLARPVLLRDVRRKERKFLVIQIARVAFGDLLVEWYVVAARCHGWFLRDKLRTVQKRRAWHDPPTLMTTSQSQEPMV